MPEKTPEKIKVEAMTLFAEQGYEATTMKDISKKVGIKAPSIYAHFTSKEELFFEIINYCFAKYTKFLKNNFREIANESDEEQLFKMFEARINFFIQHKVVYKFLFRVTLFPPLDIKDKLIEKWQEHSDKYSEFFYKIYLNLRKKQVIKNITMEQFIYSFQRAFIGYIVQIIELDYKSQKENLRDVWQLYWEGIKQ